MDVDRKEALAAVRTVRKGVSSRPGIPALTGIKITAERGRITLEATDLEVSVRIGSPYPSFRSSDWGTEESWAALVPAKLLSEALSGSKSERVPFGPSDYGFMAGSANIRTLPLEDFPNLPESVEPGAFLPLERFCTAAAAVLPACSRDEARPVLTGMLFETGPDGMTLFGTDSYRLHTSELEGFRLPAGKWIVPARSVKAFLAIVGRKTAGRTFALELGTSDVAFTVDETTLRSRIIEGEYPNYRQLLPDVETVKTDYARLEVNPVTFAGAVLEVGSVCGRDARVVRMSLNGSVELDASSPDLGSAHVTVSDATWNGEDFAVAFNPDYFADAITAVGATVLNVRDGLKPLVAVGPGGTALVMPVRLPAVAS